MSRSFEGLDDVVRVVNAAETADQALVGMAATIGDRFGLWTTALVLAEERRARVVAIWSATPSFFEPGTDISAHLTDETLRIYESVRSGTVLAGAVSDLEVGLMNDLLEGDGLRSFALIPLSDGDAESAAVLCVFSSAVDGISADDAPFFSGVGEGTEARLVALARAAEAALETSGRFEEGPGAGPGPDATIDRTMSRSFAGLDDVVVAVNARSSAEEALDAIVEHLRERYGLVAASLLSLGDETVTIVATWTQTQSFFEPGIEINVSLSEDIQRVVALLRRWTVMAGPVQDLRLGMLADVLETEGLAAFGVVPVGDGEQAQGVIGLLSDRERGLTPDDVPFLTGVGRGVEKHLAPLIRSAKARFP